MTDAKQHSLNPDSQWHFEFAQKTASVYQLEPAEVAQEFTALVEETYNLVETHLPEIVVEWLR